MSVPESVRLRLALLSGNRCAMPTCRRLLLELRGDQWVLVGEAAHIAAEHGGEAEGKRGRPPARFDPTMPLEERNSLPNLLYLCLDCHTEIDTLPNGEQNYPACRLRAIKAKHEADMAAAIDQAASALSFHELEEATRWVSELPSSPMSHDFSRIPIEDKIRKHSLSVSSQNVIRVHLAATSQVRSFIQSLSQDDPGFPDRLKSGFLTHYYRLRSEGMSSGEHLFDSMCLFAQRGFLDPTTRFAAQAVLIYLFETCEVFEK